MCQHYAPLCKSNCLDVQWSMLVVRGKCVDSAVSECKKKGSLYFSKGQKESRCCKSLFWVCVVCWLNTHLTRQSISQPCHCLPNTAAANACLWTSYSISLHMKSVYPNLKQNNILHNLLQKAIFKCSENNIFSPLFTPSKLPAGTDALLDFNVFTWVKKKRQWRCSQGMTLSSPF